MIPVVGYPKMNSQIRQLNTALSELISQCRSDKDYTHRAFSTNNDALSSFICRNVNKSGTALTLSEYGQIKLWLHLRDSLNRALRRIPPRK